MRVVRRPKPVEGIVAESFPLCHRKSNMQMRILVKEIYHKLFRAYGSMHWWPGETPFEVMVGALLTQNTSWKNVEKAIRQLKERGVLGIEEIHRLEKSVLASLIRPSGCFRIKADRLKALVDFLLEEYGGKLVKMKRERLETLRDKLLSVKGIGPETADSILLYALEKPIFVVDAYTKRILSRHGMIPENAPYGEVQDLFMKNLPLDEKLFNEYHALLVHLGKTSCKRNPKRVEGSEGSGGQEIKWKTLGPWFLNCPKTAKDRLKDSCRNTIRRTLGWNVG